MKGAWWRRRLLGLRISLTIRFPVISVLTDEVSAAAEAGPTTVGAGVAWGTAAAATKPEAVGAGAAAEAEAVVVSAEEMGTDAAAAARVVMGIKV